MMPDTVDLIELLSKLIKQVDLDKQIDLDNHEQKDTTSSNYAKSG